MVLVIINAIAKAIIIGKLHSLGGLTDDHVSAIPCLDSSTEEAT